MLEHSGPARRIAMCRHQPRRFVVTPEPRRIRRADRAAIDQHFVGARHLHRRRIKHRTIELYPPLGDQPLGVAARARRPAHDGGLRLGET
jgi:hypothetical protein